ncbi:MAG: hypothetical protein HY985_03470 [Magnetospirillum sp.]|nr:hypothetical protein [Magnetospirillum sp.]
MPKGVVAIATCHHEKLDGSGYPMEMKTDEINDIDLPPVSGPLIPVNARSDSAGLAKQRPP